MSKLLKGFALAVSMLTIIPFFKIHDFYKGINGYAVMSYPLVGFLLGLILYVCYSILSPYIPVLHLSVIIFVLWVIITGALHLDGFSDTIDGIFVQKEKSLEVMKDPNTGGMGMIFSVTFLILKASSLVSIDALYLLPIILMLSRLNTVLSIYLFPYVSPNGMSTLAKEELTSSQLFIALAYSLVLVTFFGAWSLVFVAFLTLFLIKLFFMKRYGGFTGDIYGFSIEVTELFLLNAIIFGLAV